MKTAIINIKTDARTKEEAQKLAEELGFSLSSIVTASLKQFIRTQEIHVSAKKTMSPYLQGILKDVERDISVRKNLSRSFKSAGEMDTYLDTL
jgi:addiction module RelB/DinJ family antitoxin